MNENEPVHPFANMDEFNVADPVKLNGQPRKGKTQLPSSAHVPPDPDVNGNAKVPETAKDGNLFDPNANETISLDLPALRKQIPGLNGMAKERSGEVRAAAFDLSSLTPEKTKNQTNAVTQNGQMHAVKSPNTDDHHANEETPFRVEHVTQLTTADGEGGVNELDVNVHFASSHPATDEEAVVDSPRQSASLNLVDQPQHVPKDVSTGEATSPTELQMKKQADAEDQTSETETSTDKEQRSPSLGIEKDTEDGDRLPEVIENAKEATKNVRIKSDIESDFMQRFDSYYNGEFSPGSEEFRFPLQDEEQQRVSCDYAEGLRQSAEPVEAEISVVLQREPLHDVTHETLFDEYGIQRGAATVNIADYGLILEEVPHSDLNIKKETEPEILPQPMADLQSFSSRIPENHHGGMNKNNFVVSEYFDGANVIAQMISNDSANSASQAEVTFDRPTNMVNDELMSVRQHVECMIQDLPEYHTPEVVNEEELRVAPEGKELPVPAAEVDLNIASKTGAPQEVQTVPEAQTAPSPTIEVQPPLAISSKNGLKENLISSSRQLADEALTAAIMNAADEGEVDNFSQLSVQNAMEQNDREISDLLHQNIVESARAEPVSPVPIKGSQDEKPKMEGLALNAESELEEVKRWPGDQRPAYPSLSNDIDVSVWQSLAASSLNIPEPSAVATEPTQFAEDQKSLSESAIESPTGSANFQGGLSNEMMGEFEKIVSPSLSSQFVENSKLDLTSHAHEPSNADEATFQADFSNRASDELHTLSTTAASDVESGEDTKQAVVDEVVPVTAEAGEEQTNVQTEDIYSVRAVAEHAVLDFEPSHSVSDHDAMSSFVPSPAKVAEAHTPASLGPESAAETAAEPHREVSQAEVPSEPVVMKQRESSLEPLSVSISETAAESETDAQKEEAICASKISEAEDEARKGLAPTILNLEPEGISVNSEVSVTGHVEEKKYVSIFEEMASVEHPFTKPLLEDLPAKNKFQLPEQPLMSDKSWPSDHEKISTSNVNQKVEAEREAVHIVTGDNLSVADHIGEYTSGVIDDGDKRTVNHVPSIDITDTMPKILEQPLALHSHFDTETAEQDHAPPLKSSDKGKIVEETSWNKKRPATAGKLSTKREQKPGERPGAGGKVVEAARVVPSPRHEKSAMPSPRKTAHPANERPTVHHVTKKAHAEPEAHDDQRKAKQSEKTTATAAKKLPQVNHLLKTKKHSLLETAPVRRTHTDLDTKHVTAQASPPIAALKKANKISRRTQSHSPTSLEKRNNRIIPGRSKLGAPHDEKQISKETPEVADQRRRDAEAAFQMWLQRKDEERRLQKSRTHTTKQVKEKPSVDTEKRKAEAEAAYQAWLHRKREEKFTRKAPLAQK